MKWPSEITRSPLRVTWNTTELTWMSVWICCILDIEAVNRPAIRCNNSEHETICEHWKNARHTRLSPYSCSLQFWHHICSVPRVLAEDFHVFAGPLHMSEDRPALLKFLFLSLMELLVLSRDELRTRARLTAFGLNRYTDMDTSCFCSNVQMWFIST